MPFVADLQSRFVLAESACTFLFYVGPELFLQYVDPVSISSPWIEGCVTVTEFSLYS